MKNIDKIEEGLLYIAVSAVMALGIMAIICGDGGKGLLDLF